MTFNIAIHCNTSELVVQGWLSRLGGAWRGRGNNRILRSWCGGPLFILRICGLPAHAVWEIRLIHGGEELIERMAELSTSLDR